MADLQHLFQLGQQVQGRLQQLQTELAGRTVEATAGAGLVRVQVDGRGSVRGLHIEPLAFEGRDPELLADLKAAGARNYSIFRRNQDLFAYLEVDDFDAFTRHMAGSEANARWQSEMASLIDPLTDPATGFHRRVTEVFHLE